MIRNEVGLRQGDNFIPEFHTAIINIGKKYK